MRVGSYATLVNSSYLMLSQHYHVFYVSWNKVETIFNCLCLSKYCLHREGPSNFSLGSYIPTNETFVIIVEAFIKTSILLTNVSLRIVIRRGFIVVNRGVHHCWPWSTGVQKIKFRNMAQFPRFFVFWSQTEAYDSMPILQEMAFLGF